jgi:thiol:disulfide interchange protein DsbD
MRMVLPLVLGVVSITSYTGCAEHSSFLPPDDAFGFDAAVRDAHTLQASFNVTPGYYLYRDRIHFSINDGAASIAVVRFPTGEMEDDPNFGYVEVFHHPFQVEIAVDRAHTDAISITLNTSYQGCSAQGFCYFPIATETQLNMPDTKTGVRIPPDMMTPSAPLSLPATHR